MIPAIKKCHLPPDTSFWYPVQTTDNCKSSLDIPEASPPTQLALVLRSGASAYQSPLWYHPVTSPYNFRFPEWAQSVAMRGLVHQHLVLGHRCSETERHDIVCHLEIIAKKRSHAAVLTRLP